MFLIDQQGNSCRVSSASRRSPIEDEGEGEEERGVGGVSKPSNLQTDEKRFDPAV